MKRERVLRGRDILDLPTQQLVSEVFPDSVRGRWRGDGPDDAVLELGDGEDLAAALVGRHAEEGAPLDGARGRRPQQQAGVEDHQVVQVQEAHLQTRNPHLKR
jgi:hypothetical protein